MHSLGVVAQVVIALGIFNVWVLRYGKPTAYRGGSARNMREEFAAYGLSYGVMCLIGGLKIALAIALVVGIWVPVLVMPAAIGMAVLMVGAIGMHVKAGDPPLKALPATCMLALSIVAAVL
ncbi:DoxX family protein [Humisphaera borealis]|uniref:DoxX family protein n=1 Tax=Humisphaera borealis TaxID=2807512 RepID=A0A7M2WSQ7_9BACT|nr:DoxX family protein [Humisphaera borealis]QOV88555.1 DoxX family protein [Humisphaera borealis]